ncbi:guanylate kinase [Fructilactobacillus sp. Tb1]|uniref:guanylate kinase n=1 Tax=Fructilactobacillus sp. Tb1 TaxID=3422304 RepID=UPI003D2A5E69
MKEDQRVIVLTGAAGTGKTTVQDYLKQTYDIPRIITHTTRDARAGEKNGVNYYFENQESFDKLHLLESVDYAGKKYGSSWEGINRALAKHKLASIVLDTKGAITYQKKLGKNAVVLFLNVDNQNELKKRMLNRGDKLAEVEKRIQSKETNRDFSLPSELAETATVLKNENLPATKQKIDDIIKNLMID